LTKVSANIATGDEELAWGWYDQSPEYLGKPGLPFGEFPFYSQ
jgi:hypothetical protein